MISLEYEDADTIIALLSPILNHIFKVLLTETDLESPQNI